MKTILRFSKEKYFNFFTYLRVFKIIIVLAMNLFLIQVNPRFGVRKRKVRRQVQ